MAHMDNPHGLGDSSHNTQKKKVFNALKTCTRDSAPKDSDDSIVKRAQDKKTAHDAAKLVERSQADGDTGGKDVDVRSRSNPLQEANDHLDTVKLKFQEKHGMEAYAHVQEGLEREEAGIAEQYRKISSLDSIKDRRAINDRKDALLQNVTLLADKYENARIAHDAAKLVERSQADGDTGGKDVDVRSRRRAYE
jgi:hypothetical protein